jgi:hypothetical protein
MHLKFMDPKITRKLLEGHGDCLTKPAEEREKFYATYRCPRCGGACKKLGNYATMFTGDDPLPRFCLVCTACGEEFDPETGITLKLGNVGHAITPTIPILGGSD